MLRIGADYIEPNGLVMGKEQTHSLPLTDIEYFNESIYLLGEITREKAWSIVRQIRCAPIIAGMKDDRDAIMLFIDSDGGDLTSAYMICDAIQASNIPIITIVMGHAYSAAALVLSAGHRKAMYEHARIMLHQPNVTSASFRGDIVDVKMMADRLNDEQKTIVDIFSTYTGKEPSDILKAMETVTYFNASQAKAFGLIDGVIKSHGVVRSH